MSKLTPREALKILNSHSQPKYGFVDIGDGYKREQYLGREKLYKEEFNIVSQTLDKADKQDEKLRALIHKYKYNLHFHQSQQHSYGYLQDMYHNITEQLLMIIKDLKEVLGEDKNG